MKVLVGCEFSGIVRDAFRSWGHDAMSCDLLPTEQNGPHYLGDIRDLLYTERWDLLVAFPPCTYLANSGARWNTNRRRQQGEALAFVFQLLVAPIPHIALENPIGAINSHIRQPDQIIHPWQFGHGETKSTCLWLKNLPLLQSTAIVDGRAPRTHCVTPGADRWKNRSRTLPGIAAAMAEQWGNHASE